MSEPISITLQAGHVEDVAALANSAGLAGGQKRLQGMYITVDETMVKFETTNSYVMSTRRGTIGEFGGKVFGTGRIHVTSARDFAAVLRRFAGKDPVTLTFNVGLGEVEFNRMPQAVRFEDITNGLVGPDFDRYFEDLFVEEQDNIHSLPPLFSVDSLRRASASAGRSRHLPMYKIQGRKWGMRTREKDSWMFGTIFLETWT